MNRRNFLKRSALLATGGILAASSPALAEMAMKAENLVFDADLYALFKNPTMSYQPFVRWWWLGNKVEAPELVRELRLLKQAGIGGVEIYPVGFPEAGDSVNKPTIHWLSQEWVDMLQVTFDEAKKLDMTCDLMVGTGWPYAGDWVPREDMAQAIYVHAIPLTGPTLYETSQFNLYALVDPEVTVPSAGREMSMFDLRLVPNPMTDISQAIDLKKDMNQSLIKVDVPQGEYMLYAVVKVHGFAEAINEAPGGNGPFIDHMKPEVMRRYLDHMEQAITPTTGPLKNHIRSYLTDSQELEGTNWTPGFDVEFTRRRGYDLMPYLPFIMFKTHRLGDVWEFKYGTDVSDELRDRINRVRFDFELTKAELLDEGYTQVYCKWCTEQGVKSKGQAYGRGFFPLESSLHYDLPEGESWTTNYLRHKLGEEMGNEDYRRGRGYVMINKYVSSAAHLNGRRVVTSEEATNTYHVFNATLELLKVCCDQSTISGITQSIYHGFNYSPPEAGFPGWILYGSYYNEKNNWWPYFKYFNAYKARLASVLQNADMYTDMALLTAIPDMWSELGVQTEPFPVQIAVPYTSLVWEAINKHGGSCDYTSEIVLNKSTLKNGALCYGPKQYKTLFVIGVKGIEPRTLEQIHRFVAAGGRVFFIENYPTKSLGLKDFEQKDLEVAHWVERLKSYPDRCILLDRAVDDNFFDWYPSVAAEHQLPAYLRIERPNLYLMQNRYQTDSKAEVFFFSYAHRTTPHTTKVTFSDEIRRGRYPWLWDMTTGEKYRLELDATGSLELEFGPTDSKLIVFDKQKTGAKYVPLLLSGPHSQTLSGWDVELTHSRENWTKQMRMETLQDLKDTDYVNFTGTATYRTTFDIGSPSLATTLNLGTVYGVSVVKVNGQACGVQWSGRRLYALLACLHAGSNEIEVQVVTTMGNYVKTLKDNPVAQKWTVLKSKDQPIQSMGLVGPVTVY